MPEVNPLHMTDAIHPITISVVIPVYRNSDSLPVLIQRIESVMAYRKSGSYEILLVDDASDDTSWLRILEIAQSHAEIRGFRLAKNQGQHASVLFGLSLVQYDISIVMDADLQDPPEAIPSLLRALSESNADIVFAGRSGKYQSGGRMLTSRLYRHLLLKGIVGLPAGAGMFFVITRSALERVFNLNLTGKPMLIGMIAAAGLDCVSISIDRAQRVYGQSAYTSHQRLRSAINMLCCALLANRVRGTSIVDSLALIEIADSVIGGCKAQ